MGESLTRAADDIRTLIDEIAEARVRARNACKLYAQEVTEAAGWTVGGRVVSRHETVEIVGYMGMHPASWETRPYVKGKVVKVNGETGKRMIWLRIDLDGAWRRKWKVIDG